MVCEAASDLFDAGNEAGRRIARAKMLLNQRNDRVPRLLAEPLVRARIADHRELSARRRDEKDDRNLPALTRTGSRLQLGHRCCVDVAVDMSGDLHRNCCMRR